MPADQPLILRRVDHPQARDAYRVIWNEIEVGSIGLQVGASGHTFWHWGVDDDTAPRLPFATHGDTISRDDAMRLFREAWDRFTADEGRLRDMIAAKADAAKRAARSATVKGTSSR